MQAKPFLEPEWEPTLTTVEGKTRERGFTSAWERRKNDPGFPGLIWSEYEKRLSDKSRDYIRVSVQYYTPKKKIEVYVENRLRGMEQPVKSEIDALGDMYAAELAAVVGRENVTIDSGETSLPTFILSE